MRAAIFLSVLSALLLQAGALAAESPETSSKRACSSGETWTFSRSFTDATTDQFRSFLAKKNPSSYGFANAVALRKSGHTSEERLFAEYWASRSLLEMGDVHGAYAGFAMIADTEPDHDTVGILVGTLECINKIRERYPAVAVNGPSTARIDTLLLGYFDFTDRATDMQTVWKFADSEFRDSFPGSPERTALLQRVLEGGGIHGTFINGLVASARSDQKQAAADFSKVLTAINANAPGSESVSRYTDEIHLLLARSLYTSKHFPEAMAEFKKVDKSSNELAEGLSELAWSALMAGRYSEAIGAAINLQAGGLRRTFAPEGPMVMAMALNEICQYPESLRAISVFRTAYEPSYIWLSHWQAGANENLYEDAVQFLKKKHIAIPERVASEWIRSPVFISNQEEMNLLVDESKRLKGAAQEASSEQKKMTRELRARGKALRLEVTLNGNKPFSPALRKNLSEFRVAIDQYRNFRRAASPFRKIAVGFEKHLPKARERLLASINSDLSARNTRLLSVLEEIAENNQLIEVEIYNGASGDIIWQNAHPDYKQLAQRIREDQIKVAASRVWNWGHAPVLSEGWAEIWEDELGSFKSDLYDNCSSKDKYLAIKKLNFGSKNITQQAKAEEPRK